MKFSRLEICLAYHLQLELLQHMLNEFFLLSRLLTWLKFVPINQEGSTLLINGLDLHSSIFKDIYDPIWTKPSCMELSFEMLKFGIEKDSPITWLELFIFYNLGMPLTYLLLDENIVFNSIHPHLIIFIKL